MARFSTERRDEIAALLTRATGILVAELASEHRAAKLAAAKSAAERVEKGPVAVPKPVES